MKLNSKDIFLIKMALCNKKSNALCRVKEEMIEKDIDEFYFFNALKDFYLWYDLYEKYKKINK